MQPAALVTTLLVSTLSAGVDQSPGNTARAAQSSSGPASINEAESRRYFTIARMSSAIAVDGVLDDAAWQGALAIDLPYEWFPSDNGAPPVDTICLLTYDDHNLYVGVRAFDPSPEDIRAHLWDRDQISNLVSDDHIMLTIDTFGDERQAFKFGVSAAGIQGDALNNEVGGGDDWSWDGIWESDARITDEGYVVEIAIPFSQLRFERTTGEREWGFIATRSYPRNLRHQIGSMYNDRDIGCDLCQSNRIRGFAGISQGRDLELNPVLTSSRTDRLAEFPDGEMESGNPGVEPALTVRWGVTSDLLFGTTVNPDFSQVEADAAQLEVNNRFALFFAEKRPFFSEGADVFETPIDAVFTRTVVDPSFGAKLTGKLGANTVGIFAARDRVNNLTIPSNQESSFEQIDQEVTSGVVRYRRDVGGGSTLGALFTDREAAGYHNRVYGIDGFVRLGDKDTLTFQYLRSDTAYPDEIVESSGQKAGNFGGDGLKFRYEHSGRDWSWNANFGSADPDFRADYGFVPRVDIRGGSAEVGRAFWGDEGSWFSHGLVGGWLEYREDYGGRLTDQTSGAFANYQGPLQSEIGAFVIQGRTFFGGRHFDLLAASLEGSVRPAAGLELGLDVMFGDDIDFANVRLADNLELAPHIGFNIGRHFSTEVRHTYQRLSLEGAEIFTANLSQTRLQYTFNPRAFARVILQYRHTHRNPQLYEDPVPETAESLFSQLLFSYKLNARTVFFLGYSDNSSGLNEIDLVRTDRTFFLKLSYAWLF